MKNVKTNVILSVLVAVLVVIAAVGAFILENGSHVVAFETLRGQEVKIYGGGLYKYDTLFFREGNRASDLLLLLIDLPLLLVALIYAQKGSLRAQLLLSGVLAYILYLYASLALGTAYNEFFLLYIAILSAALFAFISAFTSIQLPDRTDKMPRRALSVFMIASGVITLVAWCEPIITALLKGNPPLRMDSYTTMVTFVLDLAIITPATFICAWYILKDKMMGYKLAAVLLTIIILLVPQIILATYFQYTGGVSFSIGEMVGPVSGFLVLGLIASWLLVVVMKNVDQKA